LSAKISPKKGFSKLSAKIFCIQQIVSKNIANHFIQQIVSNNIAEKLARCAAATANCQQQSMLSQPIPLL
jgi:hypothetical protein